MPMGDVLFQAFGLRVLFPELFEFVAYHVDVGWYTFWALVLVVALHIEYGVWLQRVGPVGACGDACPGEKVLARLDAEREATEFL